MAPVSTMVLPDTCRARCAAVSTIVSVPCVTTISVSEQARQRSATRARSCSVICRLSTSITVSTVTATRDRPRRSISATCVSLKNSVPPISSYSLSNVPPVTSSRIIGSIVG